MSKNQWYGGGGWPFVFRKKNPTASATAPAPSPPPTEPTQSSTALKDSDFHKALIGMDTEKFSAVCKLFTDKPILNDVLMERRNYDSEKNQTPLTYLILPNKIDFFKILLHLWTLEKLNKISYIKTIIYDIHKC